MRRGFSFARHLLHRFHGRVDEGLNVFGITGPAIGGPENEPGAHACRFVFVGLEIDFEMHGGLAVGARLVVSENSIGKLVGASAMQELAMYALDLQGQAGIIDDPAIAPLAARFQTMLMRTPATRVEGGTDEILRNIIAERVLGMPPEIRVDKNVPFNEIPTRNG